MGRNRWVVREWVGPCKEGKVRVNMWVVREWVDPKKMFVG